MSVNHKIKKIWPYGYISHFQKDIPTDKELVHVVADKKTTVDTMIVTKILSQKATESLGDWELAYQYDKFALETEMQ